MNSFRYAPLLPFALAATVGIVVDRYIGFASVNWLIPSCVGVAIWLAAFKRNEITAQCGLWICCFGIAGAHHHHWQNDFSADDIGHIASVEPRLVRIRGTLDDEPTVYGRSKDNPLVSRPQADYTTSILRVTAIESGSRWIDASGKARLTVAGTLSDIHIGDEIEATGWLSQPSGPLNPGERDLTERTRAQRIRADVRVQHSADGVVRLNSGDWAVDKAIASLRGWCQRGIRESLEKEDRSIASALLLGDNAAMSADEWDRYVRTGVIHVLAISGQHLVILGAFLWFTLRLFGVRRRTAATIVALVLLTYAMMTGWRPSAARAAIMACSYCGAILLRVNPARTNTYAVSAFVKAPPGSAGMRPIPFAANTFSLAWLVVLGFNPTDLFTAGFQLSFLCVALLFWGIPVWFPRRERTPLEQLIDESRSIPEHIARAGLRAIGRTYLISLILGIATAPLIAYWQNIISPAGIVIGPPAILLTTIALIAGFLLLLLWPLGPIASPLAWIAGQAIWACDTIVHWASRLPGGFWYIGTLPTWWVVGFYAIGICWMFADASGLSQVWSPLRNRRALLISLATWTVLGLGFGLARPDSDDLRVTVLAVDHGSCVVIETPDGRVLLYDAGATAGPDVTKRHIAPFLWSRGIRRIDEVFISHADLDHFNGLPALLDRFRVGRISLNPSFAEKPSAGVRETMAAIERRGVPVRIVRQGDQLAAGDVQIDVLHPGTLGPDGVENVRSLVVLLRHRGHSLLLTGDVEGVGVEQLTTQPAPRVDVLLTPHHGAGPPAEAMAVWARPLLVVSSQGRNDAGKADAIFQKRNVPYWPTWPNGAITIRSHSTGLVAESFATSKRMVVRAGSGE
jgi:competence protein ComEC